MLPRKFTRTQRRIWRLRRGTLIFFMMLAVSCIWTGRLLWGEGRARLGAGQEDAPPGWGHVRGWSWVGGEFIWAGERDEAGSGEGETSGLSRQTAVLAAGTAGSGAGETSGLSRQTAVLAAALIEEDYTLWEDPYAASWPAYPLDNVLLIPGGEPRVLIYHTHNSEAYTGDAGLEGAGGVIGAGRLLTRTLEGVYGIKTAHAEAVNDRPDFTRAYINSQNLLKQYVAKYPQMEVVIDLHRDAGMDKRQDTLVTIEEKSCARLLLVMGDAYEGYKTNLAFANRVQAKADALYPGLMKPLRIANDRRYNQQLHPHGILLEVGSDLNTAEDAANAMALFARVLAEVLEEMA
jgi:stage II sporulation protein P